MKEYNVVELIDDIRNDANILMKENENLSYAEACELAKKNLIGDLDINECDSIEDEFEFSDEIKEQIEKYELDENNEDETEIKSNEKQVVTLDAYYDGIKDELKDIIDISKFKKDQLEQLYVGKQMNVDIKQVAKEELSAAQIKFLCVMLACNKDISKFLNDPTFNPMTAFIEMAQ